ncbi:hypothetical protein QYE76_044702 [Lolium multiflorum]|uniref:Protein ALP1-like n=1 Tax=Lolium multiflorum TaxID=4521 RepID=A0AAD8WXB6_LOLMU|nr:hypothetical protein QYE76_044702 [Lolium multiflorum]
MENYPPHGSSSGDEDGGGDGSGVDGEAFRGTSPLRQRAGTETPVPQILASRWRRPEGFVVFVERIVVFDPGALNRRRGGQRVGDDTIGRRGRGPGPRRPMVWGPSAPSGPSRVFWMLPGMYKGCIVILEAVATHDLWIWHSFFGMPGSNNDINILNCSPIFSKLVEGHAPPVNYVINGRHYNKGYYLADGIYPKWATFVKTISKPSTPKLCEFVKKQEACRKDVERAFGVLQQRFAVVRFPAMTWSKDQMWEVMNYCVCLHNMIIENERKYPVPLAEQEAPHERDGPLAQPNHQVPTSWAAFIAMRQEIRDSTMHQQLQDDLVEHIWTLRGNANADAN